MIITSGVAGKDGVGDKPAASCHGLCNMVEATLGSASEILEEELVSPGEVTGSSGIGTPRGLAANAGHWAVPQTCRIGMCVGV